MAYIQVVKGNYKDDSSVRDLIKYVLDKRKCPHQIWHPYLTSDEDIKTVINKFITVAKLYRKNSGKRMHHVIINFAPEEKLTHTQYLHIGYKIADFFQNDFQVVFALHECDKWGKRIHPHIHMAINAINYNTGKRMDFDKSKVFLFRNYVSTTISDEINRWSN